MGIYGFLLAQIRFNLSVIVIHKYIDTNIRFSYLLNSDFFNFFLYSGISRIFSRIVYKTFLNRGLFLNWMVQRKRFAFADSTIIYNLSVLHIKHFKVAADCIM